MAMKRLFLFQVVRVVAPRFGIGDSSQGQGETPPLLPPALLTPGINKINTTGIKSSNGEVLFCFDCRIEDTERFVEDEYRGEGALDAQDIPRGDVIRPDIYIHPCRAELSAHLKDKASRARPGVAAKLGRGGIPGVKGGKAQVSNIAMALAGSDTGALVEIKTQRVTAGTYRSFDEREGAATRREKGAEKDRIKDAKSADAKYNRGSYSPPAPGPVELRLRSFGRVQGVAVGGYGEWGAGLVSLVHLAAELGAKNWHETLGCSEQVAKGQLLHKYTTEIGMAAHKQIVSLMLRKTGMLLERSACARELARDDKQRQRYKLDMMEMSTCEGYMQVANSRFY